MIIIGQSACIIYIAKTTHPMQSNQSDNFDVFFLFLNSKSSMWRQVVDVCDEHCFRFYDA